MIKSIGFLKASTLVMAVVSFQPLMAQQPDPTETAADSEHQAALEQMAKDKELLEAQKALLEQQKAVVGAQKALLDQQIAALGLPQFENRTTLSGDNAGKIEGQLLATASIVGAADAIADSINRSNPSALRPVILLAGDEKLPIGDALIVSRSVDYRATQLDLALRSWTGETRSTALTGPGIGDTITLMAAAITTLSKLFATETTISAIDLPASDQLLMRSVAGRVANAYRLNAIYDVPEASSLIARFGELEALVAKASAQKHEPPKGAKVDPKKAKWGALQAELALATKTVNLLTTPNDTGVVPLYAAARYIEVMNKAPLVASIKAEFSGGSVVLTKNFGTTILNRDPLAIGGGIGASYLVTDPKSGVVVASGIVRCRTPYTSIRKIQGARAEVNTTALDIPDCTIFS